MRKKLDPRIRNLIESSVTNNHRSLVLLTGPRAKDQVVIIHYLLSKASLKCRPTVLWCYKKELGFSTHRKKRMRRIQKHLQTYKSTATANDDPFELFVVSTEIRWCFYSESHKILGQTFGMLVLQDFEALTPNLLARTVETVQGGGVVVIVVPTLKDILTSDMHEHLTSHSDKDTLPRFNKRFLLSIRSCKQSSLILNDKLDVVWASNKELSSIMDIDSSVNFENVDRDDRVGKLCKTQDQLNAYLSIIQHFAHQSNKRYLALSATRGRGKSACMGIAVAHMIGGCVDQCFVTAPAVENVSEFFRFLIEGLKARSFQQVKDFEIEKVKREDSDGDTINAILLCINGRRHRIEYSQPEDLLSKGTIFNAMLVVDEAAALAIPIINRLPKICQQLMFASTLDGYEGTGRALALQFYNNLRQQSSGNLLELSLQQPIRYGQNDPIERWLYKLLCLRCEPKPLTTIPKLEDCNLYAIDRDLLFSCSKVCEAILVQVNSILTSAHYRNTPNDLQMLSDAPAHSLFVLLHKDEHAPVVLCVLQVVFEGKFDIDLVHRSAGDMLPWTLCQQFGNDSGFSKLSGIRVVRIATHPEAQRKGFGSHTMKLFQEHFLEDRLTVSDDQSCPKKSLFVSLEDRVKYANAYKYSVAYPTKSDYIGVSYGVSEELLNFWLRLGYLPVYLRQTPSPLTGQNTCIMIKASGFQTKSLIDEWCTDFSERTARLCMTEEYRRLSSSLLMHLISQTKQIETNPIYLNSGRFLRMKSCANGQAELSLCIDVLSYLITEQWVHVKSALSSPLKRLLILAIAGQGKSMHTISKEIDLPVDRLLVSCCTIVKELFQFCKEQC